MASSTAEYMALFRALEMAGHPQRRLFDDPDSVRFLRPSLSALVRLSHILPVRAIALAAIDWWWPGARTSGVARTRFIDDALVSASRAGRYEQVVLLGAGFDCRAHRLSLSPAPVFFEVDLPETQELKRERLGHRVENDVRYAPCDFRSDSLAASLEKSGFRGDEPSFFLWEGVTNYLSPEAVDDVLAYVRSTGPGSALLFTYVDRRVLDDPGLYVGSQRLQATLRSSNEPWTFGLAPSRLGDFLAQRGFRLVCDKSSTDYRARYLGATGPHLRGYEFYRAAVALVDGTTVGVEPTKETTDAQGQPGAQ